MKKILFVAAVVVAMSSCKKSYNCTCDTVQTDGASTKFTYELKKQSYEDANDFCERYEDDLNAMKDGTTGCHL